MSQQITNRAFDDLARALAEGSISRRRALKLFAGSAIAALIPSRALAQQQKVTICHKPGTPDEKTIEVSNSAVNSHLRHGDQLGACCLPNGDTCSTSSDCCSGNCVDGKCSACPAGTVLLCNGTCAKPCASDADCTGCRFICAPEAASDPPRSLCSNPTDSPTPCTTDCDCPSGQFCREFTGVGGNFCVFAC